MPDLTANRTLFRQWVLECTQKAMTNPEALDWSSGRIVDLLAAIRSGIEAEVADPTSRHNFMTVLDAITGLHIIDTQSLLNLVQAARSGKEIDVVVRSGVARDAAGFSEFKSMLHNSSAVPNPGTSLN